MKCSFPIIRIDAEKYPEKGRKDINGGYMYPLDAFDELKLKIPREDIVLIPCGQCLGCRLTYSLQWAARMEIERRSWKYGYFLTLTYSEEFLDKAMYYDLYMEDFYQASLDVREMQLFLKRFRRKIEPFKCKVFYCGEYGDRGQRPHYHCIILTDFELPLNFKFNKDFHNYYTCALCDEAWSHKGFVIISDFTFEDAAYVARYCVKKVNNIKKRTEEVNVRLGHVPIRTPPFSHMSTRPAICREYSEEHLFEIYKDDLIYTRRKDRIQALAPPRYFDKRLEVCDPDLYDTIKERRKLNALHATQSSDDFISMIKKKDIINESKFKFKKRPL